MLGMKKTELTNQVIIKQFFLRDFHQNILIAHDILTDMQVILVRVWSDGFQAHQIKAKNESNSLQIFTWTILAPKYQNTNRHKIPFAMFFKRKNHRDFLIQLLEELKIYSRFL